MNCFREYNSTFKPYFNSDAMGAWPGCFINFIVNIRVPRAERMCHHGLDLVNIFTVLTIISMETWSKWGLNGAGLQHITTINPIGNKSALAELLAFYRTGDNSLKLLWTSLLTHNSLSMPQWGKHDKIAFYCRVSGSVHDYTALQWFGCRNLWICFNFFLYFFALPACSFEVLLRVLWWILITRDWYASQSVFGMGADAILMTPCFDTFRPRQNDCNFAGDIFKCIQVQVMTLF